MFVDIVLIPLQKVLPFLFFLSFLIQVLNLQQNIFSKTKSNIVSSKNSCLLIPDYIIKTYSIFSDFFPNLDFVTFHTLYAAQEFPKNILSPMNLLPLIPFPHVMLPILPTGQNMGQKSHVNIPPLELPPLCCYSHSS